MSPDYSRSVFATDLIGLYAVGGTSFGMHESQSRLWENHIVRSPDFWRLHFPALQAEFPQQLAGGLEPGNPARPGFAGAERRTGRCGDAGVSCAAGRQNNSTCGDRLAPRRCAVFPGDVRRSPGGRCPAHDSAKLRGHHRIP